MRARVLRTFDLTGAWFVSDVSRSGHVLLWSASEGLLLVAPNDAVRQWPTERGHGRLSTSGHLLVFRFTTRTTQSQLVLLSHGGERVVTLAPEVHLEHGFETHTWATDETFWLAGYEPGQEDLWIGEIDFEGRVLRSTSFTPAHWEGMLHLSVGPGGRAWLTWGNGQDGVWAYTVRGENSRLRVEHVPAEWVTDGLFDAATGDTLSIEGGKVVRRDPDLTVRGSLDPAPVRFDRLVQHPQSILALNLGTHIAWPLGVRADRIGDPLHLTTLFEPRFTRASLRTESAGDVLVTSASTEDRGATRLVFWEPEI